MLKLFKRLAIAALVLAAATPAAAQLPATQVKDTAGRTIDTSTLSNDGKPFVISFFATWCKPCLRELTAIAEVYPEWQEETGMKMYVVSIDDAQNTNKVKPLADERSWEYDVLLDANSEFFRAMGAQSVPHLIICDGAGKVVYTHSGYTDGSEQEIIRIIRELNAAE